MPIELGIQTVCIEYKRFVFNTYQSIHDVLVCIGLSRCIGTDWFGLNHVLVCLYVPFQYWLVLSLY